MLSVDTPVNLIFLLMLSHDLSYIETSYKETNMKILDLAKEMEIQGRDYYHELANETPIESLTGIFQFLASEEQKHFDIFNSLDHGSKVATEGPSELVSRAKEVFSGLSENFRMPEAIYDYEAAYRKALDLEKKSIAYYTEIKSKLSDPGEIPTIDFIISQERIHARLMETLMEFVRKPKIWLENAEWNHLDAY